jgi:hypothetical protein
MVPIVQVLPLHSKGGIPPCWQQCLPCALLPAAAVFVHFIALN